MQQLAGLLSWMLTVVVRLKPFVRPLWAATAAAALVGKRIPHGAAWYHQIAATAAWLLRWASVAARPSIERTFAVHRPHALLMTARIDAYTSGIGTVLPDAAFTPTVWLADGIAPWARRRGATW